ncbi:zinc finger protein ZAT5-like [Salvia miltiorrhiza]|uniref:zinc finger protein ZAT5-like n=1 Tax=Salvia miltiorrhiza TaxID=226208 RepID=UPI0025AC312E|nr:zinc finger protein ZAT5-like [Salvia miltiorrhiza]
MIHTFSLLSTFSHFHSLATAMNTQSLEEFSASNDHMIVKGKRTKRPRPSSSASSDFNSATSSSSTEEDEDLANCLILLARGHHRPKAAAVYVYECKTCSRTFSSFQALGGHRASHKKPKTAADFDQKRQPPPPPPPEEDEFVAITPPPSRPKIHECSICGSEFASGQALGGHMRRHRSAQNTAAAAAAEDSNSSHHDHHHRHVVEKARNMLSLDLNLPAPPEEEFRAFSSNQQPQRLVFAAAALVDCHY